MPEQPRAVAAGWVPLVLRARGLDPRGCSAHARAAPFVLRRRVPRIHGTAPKVDH